jgi:hypothetical protein
LDADLWDGNQFASYLNQAVRTSDSVTFANITGNTIYVGGGTTYFINNDISRLNYINANAFAQEQGSVLKITYPNGGTLNNSTSSVTGAIKIRLPQSWTNTMMELKVRIYNYSGDTYWEYSMGGYNYSPSTTWINTNASVAGAAGAPAYTVRFAHDGTYCTIFIGELATTWSYPKIVVTEFIGGHSNFAVSQWDGDWALSFETTSFGTVTSTKTPTLRTGNFIADGTISGTSIDTGQGSTEVHLMNQNIRTTDAVTFATVNTGPGATEVHLMNQNIRTTDDVTFSTIRGTNFRASNAYYLGENNFYLNLTNGGWYSNVRIASEVDMRAPIFYDTDNTAYYVNPAGLSVLSHIQLVNNWANTTPNDGAINIRGQYPSMTFRNTISNNMWLRHMDGSGDIQHYFASGVDSTSWSIRHSMFTNGRFFSAESMRTPIFYDSDNTAYYLDAASTSNINEIVSVRGQFRKAQTNNNYTTAALWTESYSTTTTGIAFHISGVVG